MKPNIFSIATKELSQDGFFTWLLQWANSTNNEYDQKLNAAAQDLVRYLISQQQSISDYKIDTVETWRQWKHIDIIAEVNNDIVITIEDKTSSAQHSNQLERYKTTVTDYYKDKNKNLVFIYLKTGNESISTLKNVLEQGFAVVDRKSVLSIFERHNVTNQIFIEFKEHLTEIETQTNSYFDFKSLKTDWRAAEGFYMALQEKLGAGDWHYVANPTGGFLGFWYYWKNIKNYNIYIQIENPVGKIDGIKLVVKIGEWIPNTSTLYYILSRLQDIGSEEGLTLNKPDRYRTGETSTLAIVKNVFPSDDQIKFDLDEFVYKLKALERILDNFCDQEINKEETSLA